MWRSIIKCQNDPRMTRKSVVYGGIAIAILAASAVGFWVVSHRVRRWLGSFHVPEIVNYSALSNYERGSFKVLHLGKATHAPIFLYYLTAEEAKGKITADHFSVHYIERFFMPHFYTVPLPLYTVVLWGDPDSNLSPAVSVSTGSESLDRADGTFGPTWSNEGSQSEREATSQAVEQIAGVMPASCRLVIAPSKGAIWHEVSIAPTPLYECDSYQSGVWQGSYCVFRSPDEVKKARMIGLN